MTYCLAIAVDAGLVFVSDSRTNAGVDQVSTYSKMHVFSRPRDRQFVILGAGNLATTQSVISQIQRGLKSGKDHSLWQVEDLHEAADYVGSLSRTEQDKHGGGSTFEASFIVGGQIGEQAPSICLVYPAGNHISPPAKTPYLQIGESKYGKPILDRIIRADSTLETSALCALVSMDSTMRSNLTVGPPIEVLVYERDSHSLERRYSFDENSEYLRQINEAWDANLQEAFGRLPPIQLSGDHL
jgi:putative proteasome-type protease